jgi:RNA polymerase sigma-70 factor (ECF subfamily)
MLNTDGECVRLCLNGHPEAFEQLVARYHAPLMGYLCGRLQDRDGAEEVAQEAFVRSFVALNRLRKPDSYYAWLFGMAERVIKEYAHDRERTKRAITVLGKQEWPAQPPPDLDLERAIARLPSSYREVVLLRYYGELSCVELAERMDVPLGTVTKRLTRAHEMLRRTLGASFLPPQEPREARP